MRIAAFNVELFAHYETMTSASHAASGRAAIYADIELEVALTPLAAPKRHTGLPLNGRGR